jgi:regulator of nucleoside diphosphate kinase
LIVKASINNKEKIMLLLTTPTLPQGLIVKEAFSLVLINQAIEVSNKGIIRGLLQRKRNEYQEALDFLEAQAPKEANAIIGIQISTSTQQFSNVTFLYLTAVGTPVIYSEA